MEADERATGGQRSVGGVSAESACQTRQTEEERERWTKVHRATDGRRAGVGSVLLIDELDAEGYAGRKYRSCSEDGVPRLSGKLE